MKDLKKLDCFLYVVCENAADREKVLKRLNELRVPKYTDATYPISVAPIIAISTNYNYQQVSINCLDYSTAVSADMFLRDYPANTSLADTTTNDNNPSVESCNC